MLRIGIEVQAHYILINNLYFERDEIEFCKLL